MNPRNIKLVRAKIQSKVEKEIKDQKKAQTARKRRAAKHKTDEENEVSCCISDSTCQLVSDSTCQLVSDSDLSTSE